LINNRQAGRRRGRNNPRPNGGSGGNRGSGDSGNRIDSRARGNATQLLEKYRNLARDAQLAGDRVNAEYYLQFADHYFRVLADNRLRQEEQQGRFRRPEDRNDDFDQDGGDDNEDVIDSAGYDAFGNEPVPREQREQRAPQEQRSQEQRSQESRPQESRQQEERSPEPRQQEQRAPQEQRPRRDRDEARPPRPERQPRRQPIANDDDDREVEIGLPVLPPSIGRVDVGSDDDVIDTPVQTEDAPAKPRRGRRPRQPEAAE
jgi:hypothetical protein